MQLKIRLNLKRSTTKETKNDQLNEKRIRFEKFE